MSSNKNIFSKILLLIEKKYTYLITSLIIFTVLTYYIVLYAVSILSSSTIMLHIANKNKVLAERVALLSSNHLMKNSSINEMCIEESLDTDLQLLSSTNKALSCAKKNITGSTLDQKIDSLYAKESMSEVDQYILSGQKILKPDTLNKNEELAKILGQIYGNLQNDLQKVIDSYELEVSNVQILVKNTEKLFSIIIWLIIVTVVFNQLAKTKQKNNKRKILIVEDNRVAVEVIKKIIENKGYDTVIANNGQEALDVLDADRNFALVLMDCEMPVMGGFEATTVIRNVEKEKNLPKITIVALTANVMQGDKERCLACGMDDYLSKPIDFNELQKTIDKWCKHNS